MIQKSLYTDRLILRPFEITDAALVSEYLADRDITIKTGRIPYPYSYEDAMKFIEYTGRSYQENKEHCFAIVEKQTHVLVGCVGLVIDSQNSKGTLGYWVGKPHWNKGIMTEAVRALLDYGFNTLNLNRIEARHLAHNIGSCRVMEKNAMQKEGTFRKAALRDNKFFDLECHGILRDEY